MIFYGNKFSKDSYDCGESRNRPGSSKNGDTKKYNVITAENGFVAEKILESGKEVSIILLDTGMPITDAFDFLEWIQSKQEYCHMSA